MMMILMMMMMMTIKIMMMKSADDVNIDDLYLLRSQGSEGKEALLKLMRDSLSEFRGGFCQKRGKKHHQSHGL